MRFITYVNTKILISLFIFSLASCTKNINPQLPESELNIEDKLPIRIGLFLDEETRNYVYKSTGKFLIGKGLQSISLRALKTMFSGVEEVKAIEPFPPGVAGVAQVKLLAFYMSGRGFVHDSYVVLEAEIVDNEGNKVWRDLILGEGTAGVFWGNRVKAVETSIQDAISKLIHRIRGSEEVKDFAIRKFVSESGG